MFKYITQVKRVGKNEKEMSYNYMGSNSGAVTGITVRKPQRHKSQTRASLPISSAKTRPTTEVTLCGAHSRLPKQFPALSI